MAYRVKTVLTISAAACLPLFLAACDGSTIYKESDLGGVQTLSIDAKQRLVLVGTRRDPDGSTRRVVCAEPSPDALVAQAAVLAASGAYKGGGDAAPSAGGNLGASLQETASTIGLRTQSMQILRDGYYRLCEAYMNGAISTAEYNGIVINIDTFINVAMAIDNLGNAKSAPAVAIRTGSIEINGGSAEPVQPPVPPASGGAETGEAPVPLFVNAQKGGFESDVTPTAIAQIVRDFLNYKEDIACIEAFKRTCRRLPVSNVPYGAAKK